MSYPPNSVELAERAPQHGIVFASTLLSVKVLPTPKKVSTSPSVVGPQSGSANAKTVHCSEPTCSNIITVHAHGVHGGGNVSIKERCTDCEPPLMVPRPKTAAPEKNTTITNKATYCSESSCGKVVTIQPHGINPGDEVFIKVRCGDCQPPLMVPMHRATNCAT